jgi:hypothetical protein
VLKQKNENPTLDSTTILFVFLAGFYFAVDGDRYKQLETSGTLML